LDLTDAPVTISSRTIKLLAIIEVTLGIDDFIREIARIFNEVILDSVLFLMSRYAVLYIEVILGRDACLNNRVPDGTDGIVLRLFN